MGIKVKTEIRLEGLCFRKFHIVLRHFNGFILIRRAHYMLTYKHRNAYHM